MHYLQRLRDEAHRFAINSHRSQRARAQFKNPLDSVPGIGIKEKEHFLIILVQHVQLATLVYKTYKQFGISVNIAQHLYDWFHNREDN